MKLSNEDVSNFAGILATCSLGDVDTLIIADGKIRGVNSARSFVILSENNVPQLPQKIGLSRLSSLKQRLDLFSNVVVDAKESDRGEISSLDISSGRNKISFRCTSTSLIKAPSLVKDEPAYKITISRDELKLITTGTKIMGNDTVSLVIDRGAVSITSIDDTADKFSAVLDDLAQPIGEQGSVVHNYYANVFIAALRAGDEDHKTVIIGKNGTLKTLVHGHTVYLMPKHDSTED